MFLKGEIAFVTGSSLGIGREIAVVLAQHGADVAVHCRCSLAEGQAVVKKITATGARSLLVTGDVRCSAAVAGMTAQIEAALGPVTLLVNNAAHALQKGLLDTTPAEWEDQLKVKGLGYFLTIRQVLPGMLRQGRGTIINILSTAGVRGGQGEAAYAAANGAAVALTHSVANEFGRQGIRCCGVMLTCAENGIDETDPRWTRWLETFALGRVSRMREVAQTVAFLGSSRASGITGSIVAVDAGHLHF